jgi:hypothetical protein
MRSCNKLECSALAAYSTYSNLVLKLWWKRFSQTNALAYYEREGFTRWVFGREATEQTERKLEARGRCYKTFSASLTLLTNNLECHYAECSYV